MIMYLLFISRSIILLVEGIIIILGCNCQMNLQLKFVSWKLFPWSLKHDMLCGVHLFFNFKSFTFSVILSEKKVEFVWTWKQYSLENFTGAEYVAKVASRWGGVRAVQCTEGKWWSLLDLGTLVWGQPKQWKSNFFWNSVLSWCKKHFCSLKTIEV